MKKAGIAILVFIIAICFPFTARAEQQSQEDLAEQYGVNEIYNFVPDDTKELLENIGVDGLDGNDIFNISPTQLFKTVKTVISGKYQLPLSSALSIVFLILLAVLIRGFSNSFNESSMSQVLSTACALLSAFVLVMKISPCVSNICSVIDLSSKFTLAFIPAFTLIIACSGNPVSAAGFNSLIFLFAQMIGTFASKYLMPIANIFLGISVTAGIRPQLHLNSITSFIKKNLIMILTFITSGFMTLVTIRSNISSGLDAVADKSLRFALSTFVPVIGSAISDGLSSIHGYLSLLRSSVGLFAIVVIILIFIPSIIETALWVISLNLCGVCCDVFEEKSVGSIVRAVSDTMTILLVINVLCMVTTVISIGIMVALKAGG